MSTNRRKYGQYHGIVRHWGKFGIESLYMPLQSWLVFKLNKTEEQKNRIDKIIKLIGVVDLKLKFMIPQKWVICAC